MPTKEGRYITQLSPFLLFAPPRSYGVPSSVSLPSSATPPPGTILFAAARVAAAAEQVSRTTASEARLQVSARQAESTTTGPGLISSFFFSSCPPLESFPLCSSPVPPRRTKMAVHSKLSRSTFSLTSSGQQTATTETEMSDVPDVEKLAPVPEGPTQNDLYQPKSLKFWLILLSNFLALFLVALDRTIVATAVPRITDEFHSLGDIGWYAAAYMLTTSAAPATLWPPIQVLLNEMVCVCVSVWPHRKQLRPATQFPALAKKKVADPPRSGSFCGVLFGSRSAPPFAGAAPTSTVFIVGRAVAGTASAGIFSGCMLIMVPMVAAPQTSHVSGPVRHGLRVCLGRGAAGRRRLH